MIGCWVRWPDEAMKKNADRDDFVKAMSDWSVEFVLAHIEEIDVLAVKVSTL